MNTSREASKSKQRAEAILREQLEWMRVTLSSIGDGVVTTDARGCVTFLNPVAQTLTGWTQEGAAGVSLESVFKIVNEETRRTVENPAIRALREGVVFGLANHTLLIAKDGTEIPIDDSAAPIRNASGEVAGVVLVFRDVSERRRAEQFVQDTIDYCESIIATLREPFLVVDKDLRVKTANRGFYETFHVSPEETENRFIYDLGNRQWDIPQFRMLREKFLSNYHPVHDFEVEHDFQSIGRKVMRLNARRVQKPDDHSDFILLAIEDITQGKYAEDAIRQRTAQFETLLSEAPLGVYLIGEDFRLRQVNPTALPAFGDIPDLIGRDFDEVMHILWSKAKANEIVKRFRHTLETGESYIVPELIEERHDRGVTEYYEWQINRIPLPDNRHGVVCYFRDISTRVLAQKKIRDSEERYRSLFNSIDEGFCVIEVILDEQGKPDDIRYLETNPAFEQQTGLVRPEGKTIRQLVPDIEPLWLEIYGKVAATGEPTRFVNQVKAMNRWFDVYCFRLGEPETRKVAVLFSDITARKWAQEQVRISETRYRRLFESARDGILILDAVTRKITDANPFMMELLGYSRDEILTKELWEIGLLKDAKASLDAFQKLQEKGYIRYENIPLETKDGNHWEVEFISSIYTEDEHQVIQCNIRDVTERKAAEEIIRQRDELLQGIFDSVSSEMAVVDADGIITHVSRSWERFAIENEAKMGCVGIGMNYFDVCKAAGEDLLAKQALAGIRAVVERRQSSFLLEYPCHSPNKQRWFKMQVDPRSREIGGAVITHTDITERKLAMDRIAHDAYHDTLTDLANRALFTEHLHQAIAYAERHEDYLYAVLFLDLDRFKFINDTLGHVAGDRFLVHVARKLESVVRPGDVIARLSGDEFAILLNDIRSINDATRVAKRINEEIGHPSHLNGHNLFTTASIGIALSKHGYISTEEVLRDADIAMYRAKASGRGGYEVFDPTMQASVTALLKLETDLRLAIEREEFCLHYQPIVSLEDNRITGLEALVRWQHPERGLVLPNEFIPIAEETGLILPIGKWVLQEACRQLREWQISSGSNPALSISVNLSAKEFSQVNLIRQIMGVLTETGLSANNLKLEITESSVMEKSQTAVATLEQFKDLGVNLHIDDFGIGYSSLSNLHTYPVNVLKIDRSFVTRMGPGDKNLEIVQTIVQLAHNLGMEVTAEGVETVDQLHQLRALGCEYGQGYHFSKPVNSEKVKRLIGN